MVEVKFWRQPDEGMKRAKLVAKAQTSGMEHISEVLRRVLSDPRIGPYVVRVEAREIE